jgi:hypothetical protein
MKICPTLLFVAATAAIAAPMAKGSGDAALNPEAAHVQPLPPVDGIAAASFTADLAAVSLGLGAIPAKPSRTEDALTDFRIDTIVKPIDAVVQTPWKTPAYVSPTQPGLTLTSSQALPWGLEVEWQVGVAATPKTAEPLELRNASQWSIRKAFGNDLFLYLHDRGSGFVKSFGSQFSVFGRYNYTVEKGVTDSTMQVGAASSF